MSAGAVFLCLSSAWFAFAYLGYPLMPFGDLTVGCVSSEAVVDLDGGECLYVRFEQAFRDRGDDAGRALGLVAAETSIAGFFLLVNASMPVAWAYHLSGERAVVWTPTRR
jgi:hypothetical protein